MSDEIVREFLVESSENLDLLDRELVQLEKDPVNKGRLASIFRTIHSIKGTCGFLGFTKLESVAHVGENLLSRLREGELTLNPQITTGLLRMVDAVRQMLQSIENIGNEGERNDQQLIQTLTKLQQSTLAESAALQRSSVAQANALHVNSVAESGAALKKGPADRGEKPGLTSREKEQKSQEKTIPVGEPSVVGRITTPPGGVQEKAGKQAGPSEATLIAASPGGGQANRESSLERGATSVQETSEGGQTASRGSASESSIRVDVVLLDKLMNLVGELVLARNQVLQFSNATEDAGITAPSQRLNLITTELQEGVMKTRMQPIGNIWSKFPRTVRDVATACNKQVRIEMEGKETELDKTIIEAIKDPLTHIVRNSVDHGIETPQKRAKAGKPEEGRLALRAYHEGGQVIIEISDDGAGIDSEKLKRKALEKRLITQEQAGKMGEREATNLIFLAGFSTAEKITNVSGRGVGMDVVKTNIEKIGGTVDVESVLGSGTTVKMKIPLTLAIVPGLVVVSAGSRFVIPQVSLQELVRIDSNESEKGIEMVHGSPVYRLRGRLLPLAYLDRELEIAKGEAVQEGRDNAANMVVLQADNRQFGLLVDEIKDTEEIVVKPLGRRLKSIKTFAGATIMGDGKVALILDVLGLAQRAGVISKQQDRAMATTEARTQEKAGDLQTFLVFAGPDDARMALPLDTLARLEEFPAAQVERSGSQWVVQYREQILPLVRLNVVLEERRKRRRHPEAAKLAGERALQVLVCHHEERTFGVIVEKILDIVEDRAEVKSPATRPGILYAAVIENRVTELLDLPAILRATESMREQEAEHAEVRN